MLSLFPAPTSFLDSYLSHILDMLIPILSPWSISVVAGRFLAVSLTSLRLALTLPSTEADLLWQWAVAQVRLLVPAHCPFFLTYGCTHPWLVPETQVLATRKTAIVIAKSELSCDWSVFLYSFPWWQMREETDWGLKTHQVFNRWLSEKGFQITCQHSSLLQHSPHCLHYGFWTQRKAKGKVVGSASWLSRGAQVSRWQDSHGLWACLSRVTGHLPGWADQFLFPLLWVLKAWHWAPGQTSANPACSLLTWLCSKTGNLGSSLALALTHLGTRLTWDAEKTNKMMERRVLCFLGGKESLRRPRNIISILVHVHSPGTAAWNTSRPLQASHWPDERSQACSAAAAEAPVFVRVVHKGRRKQSLTFF